MRIQNAFNPLLDSPQPIDEAAVERFRESTSQPPMIEELLLACHGDSVRDLRSIVEPDDQTTACLEAMREKTPIILAARLPTDWAGHRQGRADVLLKTQDKGKDVYYPLLIKNRPILAPSPQGESGGLIGDANRPFLDQAIWENLRFRIESGEPDLFQLAHLWMLIRNTGFAGEQAWGAIIGTDQSDNGTVGRICWISLLERQIRTYSSSTTDPWRKYSALSRYEHEHRFRVRIASRALAQTGSADDPTLVASPVRIPECDHCEWWPTCHNNLADDISVQIDRSPLDAREIMTLRGLGVSTITELAVVDVDALLPTYLPRVGHRPGAETRLRQAVRRGRLLISGTRLDRLTEGPIDLPSAPVEIDFDIETSASNHVYLWGFLVHDRRPDGGEPVYHWVGRFSGLTKLRELDLAEQAAQWLLDTMSSFGETPILVWHYSGYEIHTLTRLVRVKRNRTPPALAWLATQIPDHFVDLLPIVRQHFFGIDGLGLKAMASAGAGFSWRDPDPSGLNSQRWFADATSARTPEEREASKTRILHYNEDDVRATWALRNWIRSLG